MSIAGDHLAELQTVQEALQRWYAAASPYATPEALREALSARPEAPRSPDVGIVNPLTGRGAATGAAGCMPEAPLNEGPQIVLAWNGLLMDHAAHTFDPEIIPEMHLAVKPCLEGQAAVDWIKATRSPLRQSDLCKHGSGNIICKYCDAETIERLGPKSP